MTQPAVLVVEDDASLREALEDALLAAGYNVVTAEDGSKAMLVFERVHVGLVVSDVQMSPMDGWELLSHLRAKHADIPVVLMTAYGSIEQAVQAMRGGAVDYLAKPFEVDALLEMVGRHMTADGASDVVAEDPRMREVLSLAHRMANNDLTVMISGESGTGKEVFARYIHEHSERQDGPFVAINCAAIPENMLEAVLFGYEKGAFTGAQTSHAGKFEQAQGGTLLLDEISEMGPALQAKLLRVLQEREVERLGSKKTIELDVRVLATTNRNLKEEVAAARFREDLFYRLNVLPLILPALRERPADILPLVERVLQRAGQPLCIAPRAKQQLQAYHWPGNVRELENLIQRAQVLAGDGVIEVEHLMFEQPPAAVASITELPTSLEEDLRLREREVIFEALRSGDGNRETAAARLGISPRTLRHKLAKMREEGAAIPGEAVQTA